MAYDPHLPFQRRTLPVGIGRRIRDAREQHGLSRREVASLAAIAPRTLARIERDAQTPTWSTLDRLCGVLGLEVSSVANRWMKDSFEIPTSARAAPGVGLRVLRRARGMGLVALSDATGISVSTLSRFERGLAASRLLLRGALRSDLALREIGNDRVALALGFADASELQAACLAAADRPSA